jgi:hypothetical protein
VAVPFSQMSVLDREILRIKTSYFPPRVHELKGTSMPHELLRGNTMDSVIQEIADTLRAVQAHIWIVGTGAGAHSPPSFPIIDPLPKDITRQLLLERISGFLELGLEGEGEFLLIWDISNQQELEFFSGSVATFRNTYSQVARCTRMVPALLGGLSHDWSGLQVADIIAHFAMHYKGNQMHLPGARPDKAELFQRLIYPLLQRDGGGRLEGIGWKYW